MPLSVLETALLAGVKREATRIVSEEADAAAERVRERIGGMVDQLALSVLSQYRIEQRAGEILIRVDKTELYGKAGV